VSDRKCFSGVPIVAWLMILVGVVAVLDGLFGAGAGAKEWVIAVLFAALGVGLLRRSRLAYAATLLVLVLLASTAVYRLVAQPAREMNSMLVLGFVALCTILSLVYLAMPRVRRHWMRSARDS